MYLTDLADVLRAAGLNVIEVPGWKTRGRPGAFNPKGVLCHHTAGTSDSRAYIDWMAITGRTDLNAPLAQVGLSRTGIAYVMAAGRANHGGKMRAIAGLPAGDGNATLIGIEAMNTGFEGWSPAQYAAYVLICAALNNHYGWPASRTLGHKETSLSGKIDPGKMSMPDFRADVARKMAALKQPTSTALKRGDTGARVVKLQTALSLTADGSYGPSTEAAVTAYQSANGLQVDGITGPATWASIFTQEDDMQLTDKIGFYKAPDVNYSSDSTTVAGILASTNYYVLQTRNRLETQIAALTAAVATLANSQGLDPNLVQKTIEDSIDKAMSELRINRSEES
ncbi:MAG: N-acetylmuramoyl-L-alanine amidase [Terracoccus sp.]